MADIPRGHLTTAEAVAALGINRRTFADWKLEPAGKAGRHPYFSVQAIIEADRARRRDAQPVDEDQRRRLAEARIRLTEARAVAQERQNEMQRHEVAPFEFITFVLASVANAVAAHLDGIPQQLVRQAGISVRDAEKVRESAAGVANQIANLADTDWVARQFDEYMEASR